VGERERDARKREEGSEGPRRHKGGGRAVSLGLKQELDGEVPVRRRGIAS